MGQSQSTVFFSDKRVTLSETLVSIPKYDFCVEIWLSLPVDDFANISHKSFGTSRCFLVLREDRGRGPNRPEYKAENARAPKGLTRNSKNMYTVITGHSVTQTSIITVQWVSDQDGIADIFNGRGQFLRFSCRNPFNNAYICKGWTFMTSDMRVP